MEDEGEAVVDEAVVDGAKVADEVKVGEDAVDAEVVGEVKDAVEEKDVAVGEDPRTLVSTSWTRMPFPRCRLDPKTSAVLMFGRLDSANISLLSWDWRCIYAQLRTTSRITTC